MNLHALEHGRLRARQQGPTRNTALVPGGVLAKRGSLEVRMASAADDVAASQALRYQVFYEELSARADEVMQAEKRDSDRFDAICDHLLVIDHAVKSDTGRGVPSLRGAVVGTYRLLRQDVAAANGGFYTDSEYDISALIASKQDLNFLELGRSCVLKSYRNRPTVELLWQGIWNYVRLHKLDVMLGCASLEGTDPAALALPLSFLHHNFRAPAEWDARAREELFVDMNRMDADDIDPKCAMRALPPLIKGYLRLGATIGDGAVVDHQFGTTDVLIILPVSAINQRYFAHFGGPDEKPLCVNGA